ncbi:hypothetical protein MNEG_12882 [Monoraphidium neglectum]|uniref:Uncharacterized protein n=1 Tax=Monoraphidium neglectum TaxID=145388 RepID=A0A0D2MJB6_9CHLO|nr:hypothetical protein MNEG_12882 [Monoraphidium neglectum]KIY95080.1 hypothetical protein MNEG_12882 [Monoraphidium neglectum]|eukprot:XP_013894100.1 hypothetical protein MNEG_12882 [Monoraphidium neglectum]
MAKILWIFLAAAIVAVSSAQPVRVGVSAPGATVSTDAGARGANVNVDAPSTTTTTSPAGKPSETSPLSSTAAGAPKAGGSPAVKVSVPVGGDVKVTAPGTTATTTTTNTPTGKASQTVVSAPGTAVRVTTKPATDSKAAAVKVSAPGTGVTVKSTPGNTGVNVAAPTTGVAVRNGNVAVGGVWGGVTRTPAGTTVNVPGFSGTFPGGRRMLLQAA